MPKFIPYESPSAYLARKFQFFHWLRSRYFKFNKFDDELIMRARDPRSRLSPYFLGGLNPLLAMKKDVVDTFKPYKSNYYILRDLIQPVRGVGNIVKGLFNTVVAPLIFLANVPRYAVIGISQRSFGLFAENMAMNNARAGGGLLDGLTSIIRGVTQIVTTPLTLCIRMPLRGIITAVRGKPTVCQNVEKRIEKLETLIRKEYKTVDDTIAIDRGIQSLKVKVTKAEKRGQKVGADVNIINQKLDLCSKFTRKTLSAAGSTAAHIYGVVTSESYVYLPDDGKHERTNALNFLGLFKTKRANASQGNSQTPTESDALIQRRLP